MIPYAVAALTALSFAAGFGVAHQIDKSNVLAMELAIAAQKVEAADVLAAERARSAQARLDAVKTNQDLDNAHAAFIATANDYSRRLAAVSLPVPGRWSGGAGAVPAGDRPGVSQTPAAEPSIAEAVGRIVRDEAGKCDAAGDYAARAHEWAMSLQKNGTNK